MKKHRFLFPASLMALVLLGCMAVVSCSNNFKHVPQTGFITHQVKNKDSHIPFDAYWNADDKKIWNDRVNGVNGKKVLMAVVPVDTVHMDVRPDTAEGFDALRSLAEYFQKSVATSMEKEVAENPHFEMVPPGTKGAYTLELAIISITPTNHHFHHSHECQGRHLCHGAERHQGGRAGQAVHQERAHCHGGTPEG